MNHKGTENTEERIRDYEKGEIARSIAVGVKADRLEQMLPRAAVEMKLESIR